MKPKPVSSLANTFPTRTDEYIPPYAEIPEEFKSLDNQWSQLVDRWFGIGLNRNLLKPKDGIDKEQALCHCAYVLRSFEPQHEHKIAGVAYLLSQWFTLEDE